MKFGTKLRNLDTVAEGYIEQRYAALNVFENGVLVKNITPDVRVREMDLT